MYTKVPAASVTACELTLLPGPQACADLGRTSDLDPTEGEGHQGKWETYSEDRERGMEGKLCKYFNI